MAVGTRSLRVILGSLGTWRRGWTCRCRQVKGSSYTPVACPCLRWRPQKGGAFPRLSALCKTQILTSSHQPPQGYLQTFCHSDTSEVSATRKSPTHVFSCAIQLLPLSSGPNFRIRRVRDSNQQTNCHFICLPTRLSHRNPQRAITPRSTSPSTASFSSGGLFSSSRTLIASHI